MRLLWRRPDAAAFVHPLSPAPRTAILAAGFCESRLVRTFPLGWNSDAARFNPAVVAGPLGALHPLAALGVQVQHSIVVFHYDESDRLNERQRDMLWRAFGVPVFEQVLDGRNRLLATECEAHDGLHWVGSGRPRSGLDTAVCACGSDRPRLIAAPKARRPAKRSAYAVA